MARITKVVDFAAAHSIQGAGKCARKHGHNWEATIEVETVGGIITHPAGFIADVADLKQTAFKYDHDDLDKYFQYASTENVASKIAYDSLQVVENANEDLDVFVRVHLVETKNNSADAVATNVETGELNSSAWEIKNPENNVSVTLGDFRFVGLKGAAQDLPTGFDGESLRKPDAEHNLQTDNAQEAIDRSILFGGHRYRVEGQ